jgi:ankyrin repeat protein
MLRSPKKPLASPGKGLHHSLLAACRVGDLQTAQAAVAQLSTTLDKATSSAETTKIQLILSASEPSGWTALLYAARNGWAELAQQLLAAAPSLATPSSAKLSSSGNTGGQPVIDHSETSR